ncbi:MAG: UDP-N-acetylmuramate--L-alanine ligase, partial [candidate division WOR-3 bacterium]
LLTRAGLDPTVVVGGRILGTDAGARLGRSEYLVAEADESDRSFLLLYPALAVVTNIEAEHLDVYRDLADLRREFLRFVNRVPFYGSVVLCADSPAVRQLRPRVKRRVVTYALDQPADFRAKSVQLYRFSSAFTLEFAGREVGRFSLGMAGRHNVLNALAALAVGAEVGIDFKQMEQALATFSGIHRRLERRGEWNGVMLFDDYGHHPTEIRVTLEALRNAYPDSRIIVAFQPHRFTRTRALAEDFGSCFDSADMVLVLRLYGAGEARIEGVDERLVVESVQRNGRHGLDVRHVPEQTEAVALLREIAKPGDVVLTQGAGNITALADELLGQNG